MKQDSPNVMICPERRNSWGNNLETKINKDRFKYMLPFQRSHLTKLLSERKIIFKQTLAKIRNVKADKQINRKCREKKECSRSQKRKSRISRSKSRKSPQKEKNQIEISLQSMKIPQTLRNL